MHVALVAPHFWPEDFGPGIWLRQLATDLVARGHQVTMITAFPHYPQGRVFEGYGGRIFMRESVDGVQVIRTYVYATRSKSFWPRILNFGSFCTSALFGGALVARPDVFYCYIPPLPLGLTAELLGLAKRAPVVLNVQDLYPDIAVAVGQLRNRLAIRFFERMARTLYRHASAIVLITESFRENLLAKGVPGEKLHVIPNWADTDAIQPESKFNVFWEELGIKNEFTVVYCGSLSHNTCLETVVEAAHLLEREPCQFLLVGDGVKKQPLEALASQYKLRNLRFLPSQPLATYQEVLAASDVQIVALNAAATDLSMPSKVFKIMASGRPILALARTTSDLSRLVSEGKCGVTVEPEDARGLAETLRRLATQPEELERMAQNARTLCVDRFSRARCTGEIESLLASVAKPKVGQARTSNK